MTTWAVALIGMHLTNRLYFRGAQDGPSTGSNTGLPTDVRVDQIGYGSLPQTVRLRVTSRY